jgi:hypothetical protein
MSLTTIPIQSETRNKLREFAKKSESWDKLLNRLYSTAISVDNANVFFSKDSISGEEALKRIDQW